MSVQGNSRVILGSQALFFGVNYHCNILAVIITVLEQVIIHLKSKLVFGNFLGFLMNRLAPKILLYFLRDSNRPLCKNLKTVFSLMFLAQIFLREMSPSPPSHFYHSFTLWMTNLYLRG